MFSNTLTDLSFSKFINNITARMRLILPDNFNSECNSTMHFKQSNKEQKKLLGNC